MVIRNAETTQGDGGLPSATPAPADQLRSRAGNTVFKSGPLLLSSKGIGWTSWKKRWFILTRTSLVFFRSDPSVIPQKGSEVNLTLGGIDLNNSGSVVVREDKKLLTVLFPDGRAFTLKAETSEDLYEWKTALENALAQAPSAAIVMGQNAILQNDSAETTDGPQEQLLGREKQPVKSLVVGRPILLALEDVDGAPSFLEKALTFIEQYGVKVEGILRQAADVDDVERRVREYEQGKNEFSADEDAHVIADCVKHVLRELPSSPVPASCCNALLQACRTEHGGRIKAMHAAISETFPEPNRRLLQRILRMMQVVASHKSENRMSSSAVAACMAPLLLRPLLAGDCELENDFNMGGDGSVQLLQAAAAANHAQTIVITLLEEYEKIFGEGILQEDSISPGLCSDSEESGSEDYEPTDDEEFLEDDEYINSQHDSDVYTEYDPEGALSGTASESSGADDDQYDDEVSEGSGSDYGSSEVSRHFEDNQNTPSETQTSFPQHDNVWINGSSQSQGHSSSMVLDSESHGSPKSVPASTSLAQKSNDQCVSSSNMKFTAKSSEPVPYFKRPTVWGRTPARKNLSMESIDYVIEDEAAIERLEITKNHLQNKIAKEVKENEVLHSSLERRKKDLHERRLALEKDVESLKEQLQKERDLRAAMEARLLTSPALDDKTKAELEEISRAEEDIDNLKKKAAELHIQLNQQRNQPQQIGNSQPKKNDQQEAVEDKTVPPHEKSTRSEDASSRVEKPQEKSSLPRKQPAEKKQTDSTSLESNKSAGNTTASSSMEPVNVAPSATSNSKKSNAKPEQGAITTSYALSKLTNRLNFLKERRTQIVNELQNMENSRGSEGQSVGSLPRTTSR